MSDDEKPTAEELIEPQYPGGHLFPDETLKEWINIPFDEPVVIGPLTRRDLDHLLFSTQAIGHAIAHMKTALVHFSNGKMDAADISLRNVVTAAVDGEVHNRLLFQAIMDSVIRERKNAGK